MVALSVLLILAQVPNGQRVSIHPAKDSGAFPFSVEVPKAWLSNGRWQTVSKGDPDTDFACGPHADMTLTIVSDKGMSQQTVLGTFAMVKHKHPERFFPITGPLGKGAVVEIPIHVKRPSPGMKKDWLAGKIYIGNHQAVFFQWGSSTHASTSADRKLITSVVTSVRPAK
jgi:hypothetical protein